MALDGAFLHCLRDELALRLADTRVDKIHQPSREELVILLRGKSGTERLYLSARVNSPRANLTTVSLENPASPPMFCMLLRKKLTGARFAGVRQPALERVLWFDFDTVNELGDRIRLTLAAEIMGRYSNLILVDENNRILDALKRVDLTMSSQRPLLPGMSYMPPPADTRRRDLSLCTAEELVAEATTRDETAEKALQACIQGLSPLMCREAVFRALHEWDIPAETLNDNQRRALSEALTVFQDSIHPGGRRVPYLICRPDGTPLDYAFLPVTQYGLKATGRECASFSALLDEFYARKDAADRMQQRSRDILRVLNNARDRICRKLDSQRREWDASGKREQKRLYADLINANLHQIPAGASVAELVNYYDEQCKILRVPLDPALSAVRNAQKYYKEYRKLKTAETVLAEQIARGEEELRYLETVFDELSRAETVRELGELREELERTGYLRRQNGSRKAPPPTRPREFLSDDGFTILVGRNNVQNDMLTVKTAKGSDWWFHTKNIPGSHTVILTNGVQPPETTVLQAAILAALHSKAADSSGVPVDYTQIRHVRKPSGSKPGKVIYDNNRTVYVTPDRNLAARLEENSKNRHLTESH